MEQEHCVGAGCDDEFVSGNYGVRTTPRKEYEIVKGRRACPPEDMRDKQGQTVRHVRPIEELKGVKLAQRAGLTEDEIVAVVRPSSALPLLRGHPSPCFLLRTISRVSCCALPSILSAD